jgi:hypothetical protein
LRQSRGWYSVNCVREHDYETKSDELEELTASIVLLDPTLAQYGPEANTARNLLRLALKPSASASSSRR